MRRAGTLAAAALLAVALVPAGCDLVSSLTPFGIGHQDYSGSSTANNGAWAGQTTSGGKVSFQVGSATVSNFHLIHIDTGCSRPFDDVATTAPVVDGAFTFEIPLSAGRFVAKGRFTSANDCTGSYTFEGLPAGSCPSAASASFTAQKTP